MKFEEAVARLGFVEYTGTARFLLKRNGHTIDVPETSIIRHGLHGSFSVKQVDSDNEVTREFSQEVTAEAVKVIEAVGQKFGRTLELEHLPWSADYYLQTGVTIPPNGYDTLRSFDAIFIGALGDPRVPDNRHARDILLGTRFELDLYVNYRPVKLLHERLCPLKGRGPKDVDFVVFRENTEGVYAGIGGRFKPGTEEEVATQEEINTYRGVHRIIRYAFEFAKSRGLSRVCMADKSNAMTHGHALWQRVFKEVSAEYSAIQATHYYIDALAMYMVLDPGQFQVIVTNNLFGDIITDLAATFQGGLGMAASGNIHPGRTSMFEPVHGSAPKFAGKNIANPIGAISSTALMLETLGLETEALAVSQAVAAAVDACACTADVGGALGTREAGSWIVRAMLNAEC
jgi:3-isopropylmalate dehydrogenase